AVPPRQGWEAHAGLVGGDGAAVLARHLAGATPEPRRRPVRGRKRLCAAASRSERVAHQPSPPQCADRDRRRPISELGPRFRIIPRGSLVLRPWGVGGGEGSWKGAVEG